MPAGPAPTITTSYSRTLTKQITRNGNGHRRTHARNITGASSGFARSDANVPSAVDDDRLAGHVIRTEEVQDGLGHVVGASDPPQRCSAGKLVRLLLRPAFWQQH